MMHLRGNFNKAIGLKIELTAFRQGSVLHNVFPAGGEIISRVKLADSNRCFLVKLDTPIYYGDKQHDFLYIKTKEEEASIESGERHIVYLMFADNPADYEEKTSHEDFQFIDWAVVQ